MRKIFIIALFVGMLCFSLVFAQDTVEFDYIYEEETQEEEDNTEEEEENQNEEVVEDNTEEEEENQNEEVVEDNTEEEEENQNEEVVEDNTEEEEENQNEEVVEDNTEEEEENQNEEVVEDNTEEEEENQNEEVVEDNTEEEETQNEEVVQARPDPQSIEEATELNEAELDKCSITNDYCFFEKRRRTIYGEHIFFKQGRHHDLSKDDWITIANLYSLSPEDLDIVIGELISENSLTKVLSNNNICEDYEVNCLTSIVKINSDLAENLIENGYIEISREQMAGLIAESSLTNEEKQNLLNGYNENQCGGFWCRIGRFINGKLTQQELHNENLNNEILSVRNRIWKVSRNICSDNPCDKDDIKICESGDIINDCMNKINNKCISTFNDGNNNDKKNCIEEYDQQLRQFQRIDPDDLEAYNGNIVKANLQAGGFKCYDENGGSGSDNEKCNEIVTTCNSDLNSEECKDIIYSICRENVNTRTAAYIARVRDCSNIISGLERSEGELLVETNIGFTILDAIINPDQNTIDALRFFGFEANYTRLSNWGLNWLKEDVSSSICLFKIDGYLDEAVSDSRGGLTQYERDFEIDPRTGASFDSNLVVRADVRGQRSQILPDGSINLIYSYYLRAPDNINLTYSLRLGYLKNGNKEKVDLFDDPKIRNLPNGTSDSDFITMPIPINDSENVDINSFSLNFRAKHNDNKIVNLVAPVVIIDRGDRVSGRTGRRSSSGDNGVNDDDEDIYSDFWDD